MESISEDYQKLKAEYESAKLKLLEEQLNETPSSELEPLEEVLETKLEAIRRYMANSRLLQL